MEIWRCLKLFSLAIILTAVRTEAKFDPRAAEQQILQELFGAKGYDPHFRPFGTNDTLPWGGPVNLKIQVFIRALYDINDNNMDYQLQVTFRQRWNDDRLKFNGQGNIKYIRIKDLNKIWMPDLFIANEKQAEIHKVFLPNELIRLYPNGDLFYSARITSRLTCSMNLRRYPFDIQKCVIPIPSYGYTTDDVMIIWEEREPVQISKSLDKRKFSFEKFSNGYCHSKTATGTYSCAKVEILLKRLYSYFQIFVFIPTSMLVIVSWLTFWVNRKHVTARILLALITLLTMATQTAYLNNSVPQVSYTKALDVWTGICLTFSFWALIEFIVVHVLTQKETADKKSDSDSNEENEKCENKEKEKSSKRSRICFDIWPLISTPQGLDVFHRVSYPLAFILFNVIYWPACTLYTENQYDI